MLALDDAGLARLAIAATAVPQRMRGKWLRRIARELDPPPPTGPANARLRRCRARQRDGLAVFAVTLPAVGVEEMLRADGLLPIEPTPGQVQAALQGFLCRLIELAAVD